ncbi:MAG: autotransporter domain-containing protein [Caulobacterales bacterium]
MRISAGAGSPRNRLMSSAAVRTLLFAPTALALGVALAPAAHSGPVTVNPVQSTTYNLTPAANPITFGPATNINALGDAVSGNSAASWTVTNDGALKGGFYGVVLQANSTVTNGGSITATNFTGLVLQGGGAVTNLAGATIYGSSFGIFVSGSGTVTNAGTISASGFAGISLAGGSVINQTSGVIIGASDGDSNGVAVGSNGTVTNAGKISGDLNGVFLGGSGSSLTNLASGSIQGRIFGGGAVSVTNGGSISGGAYLEGGGSVTNQTGGNISGSVEFASATGSVTDSVTNEAGAAIAGGVRDGVSVIDGSPASVTNAGSISGVTAVWLLNGGTVVNGAGGTLSGSAFGVLASQAASTVTNAGAINGSIHGVSIGNGGTLTNQATGVITGGTAGGDYGVYSVSGSTITNAGAITGSSGAGLVGGGTVTNQAGGTITGLQQGVYIKGATGTVTNAGAITATNSGGIGLTLRGDGTVANQAGGAITGGFTGVVITGTGTVTNAGTISGAGSLVVFNGITIGGACVAIDGGGSVVNQTGGSISCQTGVGVYVSGGPGTVTNAGAISGATSVRFQGAGPDVLTLQTGSTLAGDAIGSAADGATNTLVLQGTGVANNNFFNFNTLNVTASGVWALNGVSAIPVTTITSGNLRVGDATHLSAQLTGGVTVNAGGTLSGHGTIVGAVTNNGGAVSPGGSIGVLTITGNYTQSPTGVLAIEIAPGASSELQVSGTASLAGTLQLNADPGVYRKGEQFTFLTAGSIVGGFSSVTGTNGLQFSVSSLPGSLSAVVQLGNLTPTGGTANERSIASAFNNYPVGVSDFDPIANAIIALPAGAQQNHGLDELGNEVGADLLTAGRQSTRGFLGGVSEQLSETQSAAPAGSSGGDGSVWIGGSGRFGSTSASGGAHGVTSTAGGVVVGVQHGWGPGASIGAVVSYDHTSLSLAGLAQTGGLDQTSLGLYGEQRWGPYFVDLAGVVGYDHGSTRRSIVLAAVSRTATGGASGVSGGALVSLGARYDGGGGVTIEPSAGFGYSHVQQNAFTETGATGADLAVASQSQDASQSILKVRAARAIQLTDGSLSLEGSLAWTHDFSNLTPRLAESFVAAPGTGFAIAGANPGTDAGVIDLGLVYNGAKVSAYARYDGSFGQSLTENSVTAGLRLRW